MNKSKERGSKKKVAKKPETPPDYENGYNHALRDVSSLLHSLEKSHTVTGEGQIYLEEDMSYEGVKKAGEPAGLYKIPPSLEK